jgi:hypothetical protein
MRRGGAVTAVFPLVRRTCLAARAEGRGVGWGERRWDGIAAGCFEAEAQPPPPPECNPTLLPNTYHKCTLHPQPQSHSHRRRFRRSRRCLPPCSPLSNNLEPYQHMRLHIHHRKSVSFLIMPTLTLSSCSERWRYLHRRLHSAHKSRIDRSGRGRTLARRPPRRQAASVSS